MSEILLIRLAAIEPSIADAYAAWYCDRHLAEVARVPGITAIQGMRVFPHAAFARQQWGFAVTLQTSRSAEELIGDIGAHMASGAIGPGPADGAPSLLLSATPIGPQKTIPNAVAAQRPELLLALSNAHDGQHDAFNDWYDQRHLVDVLEVPGFLSARRYRIAAQTAGQTSPWEYLAVYEITPGCAAGAVTELSRRVGTEAMPLSPALDLERTQAQIYLPLA
ncbi:hypothetical protein IFT91_24440 [Pseudomonas fluorescens]|nr:hypothetical protein [Pseudomonas fluorescens]